MICTRRLRPLLAVLSAITLAAACNDSTEPEEDTLTDTEVVALVEALVVLGQGEGSDTSDVPLPSEADTTVACPLGGEMDVVVALAADDQGVIQINVALTPNGCMVSRGGVDFTLDGNPDIRSSGQVTLSLTEPVRVRQEITGNVAWEVGDRAGSCGLELAMAGEIEIDLSSPDPPELVGTLTGTACNREVDRSLEFLGGG